MNGPYGAIDPNTQHQSWSRWRFIVSHTGKNRPTLEEVRTNALRWLNGGFGSVGRAKVEERVFDWVITCEVEGPPAHDPSYVSNVRRQFQKNFVEKGWGPLAVGVVEVQSLSGDLQDGKPPAQLVVMPTIPKPSSKDPS